MKRAFFSAWLVVGLAPLVCAQTTRAPESLTAWRYFREVEVPRTPLELLSITMDRYVLGEARADLADLRLYDAAGREIPYTLRIRRQIDSQTVSQAQTFNRAVEGAAALISCDLGEQPQEHNEVEVSTAGDNFRRLADVEGSPDGEHWSTLVSGAILFRFSSGGRSAEQQTISYPTSRFRYLRVRVNRDLQVDRGAPEITDLRVQRSIRLKGEMFALPGALEGPDADRLNARPATIWRIDLGDRVPLERLRIAVRERAFSRPFLLEAADDPAAPQMLASGDLTRSAETPQANAEISFNEHFARRLKLTITDDRNPPLSITAATAFGAMRQIVFETAGAGTGPLRLYYGNPEANAPHYDLEAHIPSDGSARALRIQARSRQDNPIFRPQAQPLSERSPWLVYLVLGVATIVLAGVLLNLAKSARRIPSAK
jgi:hypothetical protein